MPKLIYTAGDYKLSLKSSPHTEFVPSDDDARAHADVPQAFGDHLIASEPGTFEWDQLPADEREPVTNKGGRPRRAVA